jgi:hypothetical protein
MQARRSAGKQIGDVFHAQRERSTTSVSDEKERRPADRVREKRIEAPDLPESHRVAIPRIIAESRRCDSSDWKGEHPDEGRIFRAPRSTF